MADPISLIGLAVNVVEVAKIVYDYAAAVKTAKEDIRRLSQEMFALKGTLDHMVALYKLDTAESRATQMNGVVEMTLEVLETIRRRLGKKNTGLGKSIQILTWPFHTTDIDRFVATIERAKTWFIMTLMQDTAEQTSAVYSEVQHLINLIHEDIISRQSDRMTQDLEDTIRRLSPVSPGDNHVRVRRDLVPGTGQWFMNQHFEQWAEIPPCSRPMLWIKGKSGAGKSSLFSSVVEGLIRRCSSQADQSMCCFFYCQSGNTASQVPVNLFGSLLAQLCRMRPAMVAQIKPFLRPESSLLPQSALRISDLVNLLKLGFASVGRCFLLVDALNETPHNRQIESLLASLCQTCPNLRALVTSTSDPHDPGDHVWVKQMSPNDVDHDIMVYVEHRLKTESNFISLSERIKKEIQLTMAAEAHGMFRWAQLGMDRLSNHRSGRDVLLALKDLPSNLNDTYVMLLLRIAAYDRTIALNAFTWLSFSVRRLTLPQLAEAVVLEESDHDLDDDLRLTDPNSIIEICGGLVQLEDGYVTLAHDSFRGFLLSDWIRTSPVSEFALDAVTGNRAIMRRCLAYLLFDEFATGCLDDVKALEQRTEKYPLLEYAAMSWPNHAGEASFEEQDEQLILRLFGTKSQPRGGSFDSWVQLLLGTADVPSIRQTEPLYYAASYNMIPILKLLLRSGSDVEIDKPGGRFGSSPLSIACYRGHSEVARILLEAGADPHGWDQGFNDTVLNVARCMHMPDIVSMILSHPGFEKERLGEGSRERSPAQPWWKNRKK